MTDDKLENLRAKIDELDLQILDLLNRRMTLSVAIGSLKAVENQNAMDSVREQEISGALNHTAPAPSLKRPWKLFIGKYSPDRERCNRH